MADESVVATPEAPPAGEPEVLKDFGNLEEAFDRAFPATAKKKEGDVPLSTQLPVPPTSEGAETVPPPSAPPPSAPKDDLPSFLTGETPKAQETPPPGDPDLPPPTGKESVGMKQLRTAYENLKKQSVTKEAEFKAQLEAASKPPEQSELATQNEQLQKDLAQYRDIVERRYIEDRDDFKQQFTLRREAFINEAHALLKDSNVDSNQWDKAMALTGTARTEALDLIYEYLPRSVQNELGAIQQQVRSIDQQKEAALSNHKVFLERLNQQDQQQRFAALKEHEKNTLQILDMAEVDLADKLGIEVYKKSDNPDHKKWNESIDRMKADARKILLEVDDPSVMARAALLAPAALQFRYLYHTFRDKYLEEKKKNDAVSAAEPSLKSRGATPASDGDEKLTFAEAVAKQFA